MPDPMPRSDRSRTPAARPSSRPGRTSPCMSHSCFAMSHTPCSPRCPPPLAAQSSVDEVQAWQTYGAPVAYCRDAHLPGHGAVADRAPLHPRGHLGRRRGDAVARRPRRRRSRHRRLLGTRRAPRAYRRHDPGRRAGVSDARRRRARADLPVETLQADGRSAARSDRGDTSADDPDRTRDAAAAVSLGPVAFLPGRPGATAERTAFAGFHPISVAQDVRGALRSRRHAGRHTSHAGRPRSGAVPARDPDPGARAQRAGAATRRFRTGCWRTALPRWNTTSAGSAPRLAPMPRTFPR